MAGASWQKFAEASAEHLCQIFVQRLLRLKNEFASWHRGLCGRIDTPV